MHLSQKKHHPHPASSDEENEDIAERRLSAEEGEGDFGASLIIGLLLVVPVIVVIIITIVLRLRAKGKSLSVLLFLKHKAWLLVAIKCYATCHIQALLAI